MDPFSGIEEEDDLPFARPFLVQQNRGSSLDDSALSTMLYRACLDRGWTAEWHPTSIDLRRDDDPCRIIVSRGGSVAEGDVRVVIRAHAAPPDSYVELDARIREQVAQFKRVNAGVVAAAREAGL